MPDRRLLAVAVVVPPAAAGVAVALWGAPATTLALVVAAYVAAHAIAVPTATGRHVSFVPAVAAATALLTDGSAVMTIGGAALAHPLGWAVVHLRFGRRAVDDVIPSQLAGVIAFGLVFSTGSAVISAPLTEQPAALALFSVAALAWFGVAAGVRAATSQRGRVVVIRSLDDWTAYTIQFAAAALFALTVGEMGLWSIVLAGLPYGFGHVSLSRLQVTDRTYRETMVALSRIPEAGGVVPSGHAERCASLVVAVGVELGMPTPVLERLEYAALLHDIGRVVLANPVIATGDYDHSDVSTWSSVIIAEARHLEPVAEIVASQHQPYRRPGESRDESMPPGSQVLRVVAAYDGDVANKGLSPTEALEHLHRGAAYDFAPDVVAALRRVLTQRGVVAG